MKSYLLAHLFLAPFLAFTVLAAFGYPLFGAAIGLAIGVIACARRYGLRLPPVFMASQVSGVAVAFVLLLVSPSLKVTTAIAVVFAFLAVGAIVSVVKNKPWTAELSAADLGDFAESPAFIKANIFFSAMWAVTFAWFSYANWQELAPLFRWIPMIVAGVVTVFGPKYLMRIAAKRGLINGHDAS